MYNEKQITLFAKREYKKIHDSQLHTHTKGQLESIYKDIFDALKNKNEDAEKLLSAYKLALQSERDIYQPYIVYAAALEKTEKGNFNDAYYAFSCETELDSQNKGINEQIHFNFDAIIKSLGDDVNAETSLSLYTKLFRECNSLYPEYFFNIGYYNSSLRHCLSLLEFDMDRRKYHVAH